MPTTLKKVQQEEELKTYLKVKAGLKNTTAIIGVLANDNDRITALNTFIEKRHAIRDEGIEKNANANPIDAVMVNAKDDLSVAMQVIKEEELERAQAIKLLKDIETIRTLESFNQGSVETYTTPSLKEMRSSIENDEAQLDRIHKLNGQTEIDFDAMAIAYDVSKKVDFISASEQIQQASLIEKSPEAIVQTYAELNQETDAVQDLNIALLSVATDGQDPADVLQEMMVEEESMKQGKTLSEARNDGDRIYLADATRYYAIGDVDTIKMAQNTSVSETSDTMTDFQNAMPELVNEAVNKATEEGLDIVKQYKDLRMVAADGGVGGTLKPIIPK